MARHGEAGARSSGIRAAAVPLRRQRESAQVKTSALGTSVSFLGADTEDFHAYAPDGTKLEGQLSLGVKSGANLAEGNGVYGEGDACLFGGFVIG